MGFKNQKTLFISAFAIVLTTVIGLVALNYTVEKISKINPPAFVMAQPQQPPMREMDADRFKKKKRPGNEPSGPDMQQFRAFNPNQVQRMPPSPPPGAQRRARGGQEPNDIERSPEPPRDPAPPYPNMYQPPPGYPGDPYQQDMQDYYQEPPPYYPPPYGDDYEDYDYPYDGDYGYPYLPEGALEDIRTKDPKVTRNSLDREYYENFYPEPDRQMIDDYLNELYLQAEGR